MNKYDAKKDIKKIFYFTLSLLTLLMIFIFFSSVILFPIYLISKYNVKIYTYAALLIILSVIFYILIKKIKEIKKAYKSGFVIILKVILSPLIIFLTLTLLGFEAIIFNLLKIIFIYIPAKLIIIQNILLILINLEKIIYFATISINLLNIYIFIPAIFILLQSVFFKLFYELMPFIIATITLTLADLMLVILSVLLIQRLLFINKKFFDKHKKEE